MSSRQVTPRLSAETIVPDLESQQIENLQPPGLFITEIEDNEIAIKSKNTSLTITDRLQFFTWAYFTMVIAAGGVTEAIYTMPFTFKALEIIGNIFLLLSIALFIVTTTAMSVRFSSRRGSFKESFIVPAESLFFAASVVAIGVTLMNIAQYGIPATGQWLQWVFIVLFWCYALLAFFSSVAIYLFLWSTHQFDLEDMTPIWIFPAYPLLLVGPLAAAIVTAVSVSHDPLSIHAKVLVFCALELQGIGFLLTLTFYGMFIFRLMTQGLPDPQRSPGLFVSVGPCGFTAVSLFQFGRLASFIMPDNHLADLVQTIAYIFGAALWGLAFWFFMLSVGGQWRSISKGINFDITFFAYVFPNSALASSTHAVGKAFNCYPLQVFGCILSVLLIVAYVVIFGKTVLAVWQRKLLWPRSVEE